MAIALSASGCTGFTRPSIADGRLAGSICSQSNIELAHRGAKTSGRKCDSLHMTVALLPKVFKLTSRPVFTMLFTIKLSDCQVVKANHVILLFAVDAVASVFCRPLLNMAYHILWESTVYICVEYSQMMLN